MMRIRWLLLLATSSIVEASAIDDLPFRIPRQLNWDAFNNIIYNAVLNFPDSRLSAAGLTLKVTNLQCTNVRVNDITLEAAQPSLQQVIVSNTLQGLDMTCRARYEFEGFLIVNGGGDLYVESFQNSALTETVFRSVDYASGLFPPHDSWIQSCQPTINIDKMEFSNGGFWGWTLEQLQGMFRGRFEDMAESRLCDELRAMSNEGLDEALQDMADAFLIYSAQPELDPLASETQLLQNQAALQVALLPTSPLLNWQAPETYPFGFFMEEAWKDMVHHLNERVTLPNGQPGLKANLLLQQNVLTDGALIMDMEHPDEPVYENHDQWMKTTIKAVQARVRGLDTLTALDPMVTVGKYTLQSQLSWEHLWLEVDLTIEILPSTQPDTYITGANGVGIVEAVTVSFALSQVNAEVSILLALDQADVEALQVGQFLQKDNILPCFLSSIHQTQVSALSVEAIDLQPPEITGFVSQGMDKVISNAMDAGFLMYKNTMLRYSKAFFQDTVRELINESILEQQESYGATGCSLLELPAPLGTVDVRELLLDPTVSVWSGGAGLERYGDLFYGFVMPTLQNEVLTDDNINERFIRPFALEQSGQEGLIDTTSIDNGPLFDFVQTDPNGSTWVSMMGWERFQVQVPGAKILNVDTVASPVDVLNPIDGKVLANTIMTGTGTPDRPLEMTMRMSVTGKGRKANVPDMSNDVEVSLSIPTTQLQADVLVAMNETSLLHFPLKDLENKYCWLATLTPGAGHRALDLEKIVTTMSSFNLDVNCVSCSSPGGVAIPAILQTMKDAGLTTSLQPYLEVLLAEVAQSAWTNFNFPAMIQDAPRLCPHHASFDAKAVARDSYGLSNGMAAPPQWSRQSVETIAAIGLLSTYASLFVVATNHLMQPPQVEQLGPIPVLEIFNQTSSEDLRLLDWTNLSATLGPWANDVFDEARELLRVSVSKDDFSSVSSTTGDSLDASISNVTSANAVSNSSRRLTIFNKISARSHDTNSRLLQMQADSFIQDNLLDEEGSLNVDFDDMQFDFAGISFSLARARIFGIDSITHLDPFIVVGPQSLQNNVQLQELLVSLDLEVQMGEVKSRMLMDFSFQDVAVEVPLILAMDLDRMGVIELGSLLQIDKILPCLLEGANQVYIPELKVAIGTMGKPTVRGSMSRDLLSTVVSISEALFDAYGNDLALALPGLFDTTIRRTLNTWLDKYVRQLDPTLCKVEAGGGIVDFRDLLLPQKASRSLGGSGMQQYGDLFVTLHEIMDEELATKDGEPPSFNEFLASWTAEQSNASGALQFQGNLLNTSANMVLGGLNATMGIQLGDIYLENIDSLGAPLSLLDPLGANTLFNTASFGMGPDPLKVTARFLLSLSDNKEMNVRNEVNVSVDMYEATAAMTGMLRILEDSFLRFPLKDVTNFYCWASTIVASVDIPGASLTGYALTIQKMDLNVSCLSCTSPQFGDLIADLYAPADGEEATDTVIQTLGKVLSGDAIQDYLDQIVSESSSRCPHSHDYDPDSVLTASEYLKNQGEPFGSTDFTTRDERSSYFNIASVVFAACLLFLFVVGKFIVWRRNMKWKDSLSSEGMFLLRRQKAKEREQQETIDMYSASLLKSPHISRKIRWMVPVVIVINIALYMGGHLGVLSTVDVEVHLAGEDFTIHNFLVFSFLDSTANTYKNGGMEMSIMLWIFTGIWPYIKLLSSLFLWMVPPRMVSVSTRGKLLLWIDTLTKLSIIDIFTLILFLAVLLVYIGGPDEDLNADGALYSMKAIVIPGASLYCIVIAQRMSRVSSRFFLDYHDQDVAAAREACARGDIIDVYKTNNSKRKGGGIRPPSSKKPGGTSQGSLCEVSEGSSCDAASFEGNRNFYGSLSKLGEEDHKEEFDSLQSKSQELQGVKFVLSKLDEEEQKEEFSSLRSEPQALHDMQFDGVPSESQEFQTPQSSQSQDACTLVDAGDHKLPPEEHDLNVHLNKESEDTASSLSEDKVPPSCLQRLKCISSDIGLAFGALAVLVLAVVGCIFAPSVSIEISDLWGLALEAETTYQEAATEYGVFFVVSSVLLKARFVLESTWDYVALGFLMTVAGVSVGMTFFVACYHFLKRLMKEGWSVIRLNQKSPTFELPSYLSLHAYKHIEIYVVAVVIGCWQLGSVSIYAIHLYCSIIDAVYNILTYIGLAQPTEAQCFEAQMKLPDNLLIFFGALLILLANFCIQSAKQYRKNIREACDLLRHEDNDAEHLSSVWNTSSKRGFWNSSKHLLLNRTATFSESEMYSGRENSPSSFGTSKSSSPPAFDFPASRDDNLSVSTISGSPSRIGPVHGTSISVGSFSGSPILGDHKVLASVGQYDSTPQ